MVNWVKAARNRFEPGVGVFNCERCGRRTRSTTDIYQNRLCSECNELAELENSYRDKSIDKETYERVKAIIEERRDKKKQKQEATI